MNTPVADASTQDILASYEAFPYDSTPISGTHPETIAAVATLHGLAVPDVSRSRVLELGCGTGGNTISMACGLPGSTFVGVDLSPRQVAVAVEVADTLGLTNTRFEARSIDDLGDDFGTFDYIICHGVFSWVPANIRAAILHVCSRNLAPNGIAYVSYNTYPGWHVRGMMRDLMLFHDRPDLPPADRVARGREMAELIARVIPSGDSVYAAIMKEELLALKSAGDSYFLHEELEPVNEPMYFMDFVRAAEGVGLQYVAEAAPFVRSLGVSREGREALRAHAGDEIQFEQYMDFVCNRTFRKTLLCHAGLPVTAAASPAVIPKLHLRGRCTVDGEAGAGKPPGVEVFRTHREDVAITIDHPLLRAALHVLIDAHPASLSFDELWDRSRVRAEEVAGQELAAGAREDLCAAMVQSVQARLVDLHGARVPCASQLSERPVGSPLARLQARTGTTVANVAHQSVELSPFDRLILLHADGSQRRDELVEFIAQAFASGELVQNDGPPATRENIVAGVDRSLENLLRVSLLVG